MSFFKFDEDDLFTNTIRAYPEYKFYIQSGSIYVDDVPHLSGANTDNIINVPKGFVSLYEYNIDRPSGNDIYPFIIKSGRKDCFKTVGTSSFATEYQYGDTISSSYNMSASITRLYFNTSTRPKIKALKNTFNHYKYLSPHYEYASSDQRYTWDKDSQTINLISVPSILYGTQIKRGSVNLKFYISGSLLGELSDYRNNGELVQVGPPGSSGSGSVAGVVLYKEGIMALTGAWNLTPAVTTFTFDSNDSAKWIYFGYGANDSNYPKPSVPTVDDTALSASFLMEYSGTVETQTLTMLAHANYGQTNHSTNPTFLSSSRVSRPELYSVSSGSLHYIEKGENIKNIVNSSFTDVRPRFDKTVYISKIGIYDEDRNLIAIAKMATPVRKTDDKQYTFKLKVDI
jgi:hypothetical protein